MKLFIKKNKYLITIILIILILLLALSRKDELKNENKYTIEKIVPEINTITKEDTSEEVKIKVDIKGQVLNPGVYQLESDSRVKDVIELAGGLTEEANTSLINLSKKITDEMVIIIYSNEEVKNSNVKEIETVFKVVEKECQCPNIKNDSCINTELEDNETTKLININTATKEELMTLTSIGEAKAELIIEYRNTTPFNTIEELMNVSGIGEALFNKIKEHITV